MAKYQTKKNFQYQSYRNIQIKEKESNQKHHQQ